MRATNARAKITSTLLLGALAVSHVAEAAIFNSKQVKQLNGKNFKKAVRGSEKLTVAAFVAPWCGYCKKLAPEYDRAAENLKGLVNIVAVDCDEDQNKALCQEEDVKGFPTLKLFPGGSAPSEAYNGPREAKGIVEYATKHMPTFVKRATSAKEVEALRAKAATKPVSLLFTSAATVTPLYKALSTDFHKTIDFYAARDSKVGDEAMKEFGVEKVPALVILEGEKISKYEGALKYEALHAFFKPLAAGSKAKPSQKVKEEL